MAFKSLPRQVLNWSISLRIVSIVVPALLIAGQVRGQGSATTANDSAVGLDEIVVTARKREESVMRTPVDVQVLTSKTIDDMHINSLYALDGVVPSLTLSVSGAFVGVTASLRGLGNGAVANFAESTVALNLDGVTAPSGHFYQAGLFDLGQIEVLKGPQALFFGKASSGGVIALHTADPTSQWDTGATAGYEFNADELDLTSYVSGPLTETLGIRIAGFHTESNGYLISLNPASGSRRLPAEEDNGGRLTLKYDNSDIGLVARLKAYFVENNVNAGFTDVFSTRCPPGAVSPMPGLATYDDCKLDNITIGDPRLVPYRPNGNYAAFNSAAFLAGGPDPVLGNGNPYSDTQIRGATLQADYDLAKDLTFTSVSAYQYFDVPSSSGYPIPGVGFSDVVSSDAGQEYTEEARLTSNRKGGWFNFMVGGLVDGGSRDTNIYFALPVPGLYTWDYMTLISRTTSGFGQVLFTPTDQWELSAGVRYTHDHKYLPQLISDNNYPPFLFPGPSGNTTLNVPSSNRDYTENNFSPEATLTYRPNEDLTAFISYKQGYKGPSFDITTTATTFDASTVDPYRGETVKGFEGGLKSILFDRQLSLTLTGYRYKYDSLQVSFIDVATAQTHVANGANVRLQGIEAGADYKFKAVPGLALSGFVNYNDAYYLEFPASPCYSGQTATEGCITAGAASSQNLAGRPLPFAAKWTGNVGASYSADVLRNYTATLRVQGSFSSSYYFIPELNPLSLQGQYALLDTTLHLTKSDNSWDLGLICRNCTNRYYTISGADTGYAPTPGVPGAVLGVIARPREIFLELTVHPHRLF